MYDVDKFVRILDDTMKQDLIYAYNDKGIDGIIDYFYLSNIKFFLDETYILQFRKFFIKEGFPLHVILKILEFLRK